MTARKRDVDFLQVGTVFAIPMSEGCFCFAVVCPGPDCAFFLFRGQSEHPPPNLAQQSIAFRVYIAKDTPRLGKWKKVTTMDLPAALSSPNEYAHRPIGSDEVFALRQGQKRVIDATQAAGLELAATWFSPHIEQRLTDALHGRPNEFVIAMRRQHAV